MDWYFFVKNIFKTEYFFQIPFLKETSTEINRNQQKSSSGCLRSFLKNILNIAKFG
jgi:hypothetical protein